MKYYFRGTLLNSSCGRLHPLAKEIEFDQLICDNKEEHLLDLRNEFDITKTELTFCVIKFPGSTCAPLV